MPKVSVIMSVFNGAAYLDDAIESVLAQTFRDFEFRIHDDGSTDSSVDIVRLHAEKDARIVFSHDQNRGLYKVLNELINRSDADYIAVMDCDDICKPQRLALQVEHLDANASVVAVAGQRELIDEKGRLLGPA